MAHIKGWIEQALSGRADILWRMHIALAQFTATQAYVDTDWPALSARQQLAACWSHPNAVTEILVAGQVNPDSLLETIWSNRLMSPRILVEDLYKFDGDAADPRFVAEERLRAHVAAGALLRLREFSEHREWAETAARALVLDKAWDDGPDRQRLEVLRGSLVITDCLPTVLIAPYGTTFDELYPNGESLFSDGIEQLLRALLSAKTGSPEALAGWRLLRDASADTPLPTPLAELASELGTAMDLTFPGEELESARHHLLNYVALASVNGWTGEAGRIDDAAMTLGPRDGDEEVMALFEVAIWRSRMIGDILERTQILVRELLRLSRHAPSRE